MEDEDKTVGEEDNLVLDQPETITTGLGAAELSPEDMTLLPSGYTGALTSEELAKSIRAADVGYAANKKTLQDQLAKARAILLAQPTKQSKADWLLGVGSTLLAPGPVGRAGTLGESMSALGKYVTGASERERLAEQQKQQQLAQFDLSAAQAQATEDAARRKGLQDLYYRLQATEAANARAKELQASREAEGQKNREAMLQRARITAAGGAGSDRFGFGDIVATASNEAAISLQNLQSLPATVTAGIAGGRETKSLFTAPIDALVNSAVTTEEEQRYNVEVNSLARYIAQIQKGGRVVTQGETDDIARSLKIKAGDTQLTRLTKMANARQRLEKAIEVRMASPRTPESLKEIYANNLDGIRAAVPFTVAQVNAMANAKDKKKTFADLYPEMGLGGSGAATPPPAAGGRKIVMHKNREIYVKEGKWHYKDDDSEVPQTQGAK